MRIPYLTRLLEIKEKQLALEEEQNEILHEIDFILIKLQRGCKNGRRK